MMIEVHDYTIAPVGLEKTGILLGYRDGYLLACPDFFYSLPPAPGLKKGVGRWVRATRLSDGIKIRGVKENKDDDGGGGGGGPSPSQNPEGKGKTEPPER